MESYRDMFLPEATELIRTLEQTLLNLEKDPENPSLIDDAFRAMHTLKGGASMCGMDKLEEITHQFENIYDALRNKKLKTTRDIIDISLATLDHFSALLEDEYCQIPNNASKHVKLLEEITTITKSKLNNEMESFGTAGNPKNNENKVVEEEYGTYIVSFNPNPEILKNGSNPIYLISDLRALGPCEVLAKCFGITSLEKLEPENCSLCWDIVVVAPSLNSILDVFIFVEDECTIKVERVYEKNIFEIPEFDLNVLRKQKSFYSIKKYFKELIQNQSKEDIWEEVMSKPEETTLELPLKRNPIEQIITEEGTSSGSGKKSASITSIRVASDKLDELMNLVSELVTTQAGLSLYAEENKEERIEIISENIEKLSRRLRDTAFSMTLLPLNNIFYRFERLVRDLSKQLEKEVDFITSGGDTDLDKTIIEALSDPLMHLIRNCMDHGIESTEERKAAGKTEKGTIHLKAYYSGANVHILIKDNGKGIDPEKVRQRALEKGIIQNGDQLTSAELLNLIFSPGFSTAEKVTDVSGRGVGMDVVKRNIQQLRGEVYMNSVVQQGTTVEIVLPLTLSIIDGLLVKLDETFYVIPLSAVEKCHEIRYKTLQKNFNKLIELDGEQIPFLNLRSEFEASRNNDPERSQIIVVHNEELKIGICVDEIIGEYQAVLKPVGKYYSDQEYISGATILGDGTIALVLDTYKIIDRKVNQKKQAI